MVQLFEKKRGELQKNNFVLYIIWDSFKMLYDMIKKSGNIFLY